MAEPVVFTVTTSPTDTLANSNRVFCHSSDVEEWPIASKDKVEVRYAKLKTDGSSEWRVVTILTCDFVKQGKIALNATHRKWLNVRDSDSVEVVPYEFPGDSHYVDQVEVHVDFMHSSGVDSRKTYLDTDGLSTEMTRTFHGLSLSVDQQLLLRLEQFANSKPLRVTVTSLSTVDPSVLTGAATSDAQSELQCGVLTGNSNVVFKAGKSIVLNGSHLASSVAQNSIMSANLDFVNMGIGGLDKEATILFRRAFASRVFPPRVIQRLGVRHVKGILLYGPPGCGKTLMARQIGQMLNAREPKIINGPEVLSKYVGESEANIRSLFAQAEEEQKHAGANSGLHMIIFDEIDAICKKRGNANDTSGVHDNVVTQLLSKMDGVDELDNILIIGMTNRKDLIDEALMRPGRFEIQMEIGLPNEHGRQQILEIHTRKIRDNGTLAEDVDLPMLAHKTVNYSGAEIAGLVRSAVATAMNRVIKNSHKEGDRSVAVKEEEADRMKVTQEDFLYAAENDIQPMFGVCEDQLTHFMQHGMFDWGLPYSTVADKCKLMAEKMIEASGEETIDNFSSLLLYGGEGVGTSSLAVHLAKNAGFTCVKVCSNLFMSGTSEMAKVNAVHEVFESAYRAQESCVIVDCIENLIEHTMLGNRFSSALLQEVRRSISRPPPKGHKLLVIGTTSNPKLVHKLRIRFDSSREVKPLTEPEHIKTVLSKLKILSEELEEICEEAGKKSFSIGVKHLITIGGEARAEKTKHGRVDTFLKLLYAPPPTEDDFE